jgi:hypothetical protein
VEKMNTVLLVEVKERNVEEYVELLLIVESMNVKENAMRDHVLLALKIQRG